MVDLAQNITFQAFFILQYDNTCNLQAGAVMRDSVYGNMETTQRIFKHTISMTHNRTSIYSVGHSCRFLLVYS